MKVLFWFLVAVAAGACNRHLPHTMVKVDSTYVVEKVRYDTVTVPGDSVPFEVLIECDSTTNMPRPVTFVREGKRASVTLELDSTGIMRGMGRCDSAFQVLELRDREIHRLRSELRTIYRERKKPSFIERLSMPLFTVSVLLFLLTIMMRKR